MDCVADIKDAEIFIYVPFSPGMVHISKNLDDLTNLRTCHNLIYGVYNMQGVKRLFPINEIDGKIIATYNVYYRFTKLEIVPKTLIFCYDAGSYNYVYDELLDLVGLSKYKDTMSIIKLYEKSVKKYYVWVYHDNAIQKGEIITRIGPTYVLKFETEKDFVAFLHWDIYFDFDEIINAYKNNV
jgi:hypothetical protein